MEKTWIRRDRETGKEEEVTVYVAMARLGGHYNNILETMEHASQQTPLTTGFADYWPKEENGGDNVKNKHS